MQDARSDTSLSAYGVRAARVRWRRRHTELDSHTTNDSVARVESLIRYSHMNGQLLVSGRPDYWAGTLGFTPTTSHLKDNVPFKRGATIQYVYIQP